MDISPEAEIKSRNSGNLSILADKILVTAAFVCLVQMGEISAWVVVLILSREFTISILRAVAASEGIVIAASWWGKAKTLTQMIAIFYIAR